MRCRYSGGGAAALDSAIQCFFGGMMMQNGAKGKQVRIRTKHHCAIDAGDVLQHGGRNVEDALVAQQVVQLVLAGDSVHQVVVIQMVEQIGL